MLELNKKLQEVITKLIEVNEEIVVTSKALERDIENKQLLEKMKLLKVQKDVLYEESENIEKIMFG